MRTKEPVRLGSSWKRLQPLEVPQRQVAGGSSGKVLLQVFCFLSLTILLVPVLLQLHHWIETTSEGRVSKHEPLPRPVRIYVRAFWTVGIDVYTPNATNCLRLLQTVADESSAVCRCMDDNVGSPFEVPVPFVWSYTVDLVAWPCQADYVWQVRHHARWLSILLLLVMALVLSAICCTIPWTTRRLPRCCRRRNKAVSVYSVLHDEEADDSMP